MNPGRAKKIRDMIGYDVGADDITTREYDSLHRCVGIRRLYKKIKKKIKRNQHKHGQ